jgi:hypothetical protein
VTPAAESAPTDTPSEESAHDGVVAKMIELSAARPSLVQPLRGAQVSLDGNTLTLAVPQHFVPFAEMHQDEYRDLARRATGKPVQVRIVAGAAAEEAAEPANAPAKKQQLRERAEQDPAVKEALDLFGGRILDVREDS